METSSEPFQAVVIYSAITGRLLAVRSVVILRCGQRALANGRGFLLWFHLIWWQQSCFTSDSDRLLERESLRVPAFPIAY